MERICSGRIKNVYDTGDGTCVILTTDKISAYDVMLPSLIPNKGIIINKLSEFWFDLTKDMVPNHMITTDISKYPAVLENAAEFKDRSMLVKKLDMIPFHFVARAYLSGAAWTEYSKTGSLWGYNVPRNMQQSQKFEEPIFTSYSKEAMGGHSYITESDLCNHIGIELAMTIKEKCIALYDYCAKYALDHGIIIADTKFEFGFDKDGNLLLGDEIFTPDCSRFWDASEYKVGARQKTFDKQFVRDWLESIDIFENRAPAMLDDVIKDTLQKYIRAYEMLVPEEKRISF